MMNPLLQVALDEERQLLARLEAVRAVIRAYGGTPQNEPSHPPVERPPQRSPRTRAPSETTERIKNLLASLLHGERKPTPTRNLLVFLDGEGVNVGGKNPIATLSALLSHADEFEPVGRKGWLLKGKTPDGDTSGAASTDEATASPIDSPEISLRG